MSARLYIRVNNVFFQITPGITLKIHCHVCV